MADDLYEKPLLMRHSVGECEMIPHGNGSWVNVKQLRTLMDRLTDDDSSVVMLAKIKQIMDVLA
jgi:hypothetical protein